MAALKSDYLRSILLRASIWKPLGSRAPLASLARSLRSPHRGKLLLIFHVFLIVFLIVEIVSVSIDLSWMFMPTWLHVGLIFRLLGRLRASSGPLGASWGVLGRLLGASRNLLELDITLWSIFLWIFIPIWIPKKLKNHVFFIGFSMFF